MCSPCSLRDFYGYLYAFPRRVTSSHSQEPSSQLTTPPPGVITSWPCLIYHQALWILLPLHTHPRPFLFMPLGCNPHYSLPPAGSKKWQTGKVIFLLLSKRLSYLFFTFFLAAPRGMQNLSSATRNWTWALGSYSTGSSREFSETILPLVASRLPQWQRSCLAMQETEEMWVQSLGWEDPLEKEITTHSSNLAWEIPWAEEVGMLHSMGLQRLGHDLVTESTHIYFLNYFFWMIEKHEESEKSSFSTNSFGDFLKEIGKLLCEDFLLFLCVCVWKSEKPILY